MGQTQFYALDKDLAAMLGEVENRVPIDYILAGRFETSCESRFGSFSEICGLGRADRDSAVNCRKFLVVSKGRKVRIRRVTEKTGNNSYHFDQLLNPTAVTFWPGGLWDARTLLYGSVGTTHDTAVAKLLLKAFRTSIRKHCRSINSNYVGVEALEFLKNGNRLTMAVQCPPEYDLRLSSKT